MVINSCDTYDSYLGELRFENPRKSKTKIRQIFVSKILGRQGNFMGNGNVCIFFSTIMAKVQYFAKVILLYSK